MKFFYTYWLIDHVGEPTFECNTAWREKNRTCVLLWFCPYASLLSKEFLNFKKTEIRAILDSCARRPTVRWQKLLLEVPYGRLKLYSFVKGFLLSFLVCLDDEDAAWYPRQKVQSAMKKLEGFNPAHVMRFVICFFHRSVIIWSLAKD